MTRYVCPNCLAGEVILEGLEREKECPRCKALIRPIVMYPVGKAAREHPIVTITFDYGY